MFDSNSNAYNSDIPINPSSSCGSYLGFPSHLLDDDDLFLGALLPYQTPPPPPPPPPPPLPQPPTTKDEKKGPEKGKRKRATTKGGGGGGRPKMRKSGKKDRHSKINTVHGPRDRRMRLSLQIARKFFDLQDMLGFDMLGFDKASKTIEWLFNKSKAAIKDLADKSTSCTTSIFQEEELNGGCTNSSNSNFDKNKKNKQLLSQRENRERARARARERTKEKLLIKQMQQNPSNNTNMEILRVEDNNKIIQKSGFKDDHDEQQQQLEDQMASVAIIEKFLTTSSSFFDFDNENYQMNMGSSDVVGLPDFPGDWMTENARISSAFMD